MTRTIDPFPAGPNVSAYVPSDELEQSLAYLAAKLEEVPGWVGVCGAPGVGKTLALRLLMRRLAPRMTPLYVPSAALSAPELERWIASEECSREGESPSSLARRLLAAGRPLLLGIDEAQLATGELTAWVDAFCGAATGARAVLAWSEADGARLPAALAGCRVRVFVEPLQLAEVPRYVETQLARVNAAPDLRAVLSGSTLERIALASGGNPRQIQRLADAELAAHVWRTQLARAARPAAQPEGMRGTQSAPRGGAPESPPGAGPATCRRAAFALALVLALVAWVLARR